MRFLRLKKGMLRLVTLFLTTIYLLSMAHTLFHNQLHQMLAHAPMLMPVEYECSKHCCDSCVADTHTSHSHTHNSHDSEHYKLYHYQHSGSDSLDHEHHSDDDENCNTSLQYIPANNQKTNFDAKITNLLPLFAVILECKLCFIQQGKEIFVLNNIPIPSIPNISYKPLRAPPLFC